MFEGSPEWSETLRYFQWKCYSNISDQSYEKLRTELAKSGTYVNSLRSTRHYLRSELGINIKEFHRCINNCMVFVGQNLLRRKCQYCETSRFETSQESENDFDDESSYLHFRPRAVYSYIPIIPRLKLLYANPKYASKMRYPKELNNNRWDEGIRDIWEGNAMNYWRQEGSFSFGIY